MLHRAAYQQLGLHDWEYDAIEVTPDTLGEFIASRDNSWAGRPVGDRPAEGGAHRVRASRPAIVGAAERQHADLRTPQPAVQHRRDRPARRDGQLRRDHARHRGDHGGRRHRPQRHLDAGAPRLPGDPGGRPRRRTRPRQPRPGCRPVRHRPADR
ncbi:hypothetical protein FAM19025_000206 [Propionibacterium freudenreichii]|nr:hypothetical protein FAM19025_000206 [Propionibacterium freudenreichii]